MEFRFQLFRGILLAGLIIGSSYSFGVTNEAAVLRDMRLDVKRLKLKVGYPGKFLEVPDSVVARRVQKYVRRALDVRKTDGLWDVGMVSVGYIEVAAVTRPKLFVGESKAEALNDNPQYFEQTTEMIEVRPGVWRTPLPLALRYFRFGGVEPLKISFTEEIADVSDKVGFNGGNDREKRMYDVALRTLRLCMREFLVDGVKRDRLPWAGDLSISLLANAYSFRDADIVKRTLRVLDSAGWKAGDINGIVEYSLWWVISHDLYQKHFNDNSFLNDEYSRIAGRLESFAARENPDGLLTGEDASWLFIDWTEDAHSPTALNAIYYGALCSGVKLAELKGAAADAVRWSARAERLKAALLAKSWDEERGLFRWGLSPSKDAFQFSRHANIYAVYFGLVDGARLKRIAKSLADDKLPSVGTPYVSAYEVMALIKCGQKAEAQKVVEKIWGGMLNLGATTFWEGFNPAEKGEEHLAFYDRPYAKSLCHAWSSAPVFLLRILKSDTP